MHIPAQVEVDCSAIGRNIARIRQRIGSQCRLLVCVKSEAYGHGAVQVSRLAEKAGVDMLGVATVGEGVRLRAARISMPILVFAPPLGDEIEVALSNCLRLSVCDSQEAQRISAVAGQCGKKATLHLVVDTGMGRMGRPPQDAPENIRHIRCLPNLRLEGLYSHFPVADAPSNPHSRTQIETFRSLIQAIPQRDTDRLCSHLANSAGILHFPEAAFDMVRVGILVYGHYPCPGYQKTVELTPAMTLKARLIFSKRFPAQAPLSYGHIHTTSKETRIGTLQIGYAAGYSRALSNRGQVLIEGRSYPVVGRVCMDHTLINLGEDDYPAGTEVTLFGQKTITASSLAEWLDTIPYEITCQVGRSVERVYHS